MIRVKRRACMSCQGEAHAARMSCKDGLQGPGERDLWTHTFFRMLAAVTSPNLSSQGVERGRLSLVAVTKPRGGGHHASGHDHRRSAR